MQFVDIFSSSTHIDFEVMMTSTIDAGDQAYSYGRRQDINDHLSMLYKEFSGKSLLEFYHSGIGVLLRRGIDLDLNRPRFEQMWQACTPFLLQNLDARWLVSACDTIVDHSHDSTEVAWAMAGTLFMNTIKLYETERVATGAKVDGYMPIAGRIPLFNGMSAFVIGHGDMVHNLMIRLRCQHSKNSVAQQIVQELMSRANCHDTVFRRFALAHKNRETSWANE